MIGSLLAITILSFVVWAHHMFVSGLNPFLGSIFMFLTLIIAVPSAVKVFNYLHHTVEGQPALHYRHDVFHWLGVGILSRAGSPAFSLENAAIDIQLHDTYFVVAHFHLVMGSASFFGLMAGVYHWFPKMYGRMMDKTLGYVHFWMTFFGVYLVFFPMHYIGIAGFPRRYYSFTTFDPFGAF